MKFSTKARYGLRAMIELALHQDQGPVPVKIIAENQEISEAYLEQIMSTLTRRGLTKSIRGIRGGYLLARNPSRIKVGDIIKALEGPVVPVDCVNREDPLECTRYDKCVSRIIWEQVRDAVEEIFGTVSLEDLKAKLMQKDISL